MVHRGDRMRRQILHKINLRSTSVSSGVKIEILGIGTTDVKTSVSLADAVVTAYCSLTGKRFEGDRYWIKIIDFQMNPSQLKVELRERRKQEPSPG